MTEDKNQNPMRRVRVEKIVLNIGCGGKMPVETAKTLLERITGSEVVVTVSKKRTTFSNTPGRGKPIGCMVTLRGKKAVELLERLLQAIGKKISESSFDSTGNVSFGVKEYIDVPGVEYDPKIGVCGFDVAVSLERPGYSVKRKKIWKKIGRKHALGPKDAMAFMKSEFGVNIVKPEVMEE